MVSPAAQPRRCRWASAKLLLLTCAVAVPGRAADDTRARNMVPSAVYGPLWAHKSLHIGNGGAGATGLLEALANDFLAAVDDPDLNLVWIQNITRHTLLNLRDGIIEVALTYEAPAEVKALACGWAARRARAFHDHFLLAGPRDNGAAVGPGDSMTTALHKIYVWAQGQSPPHPPRFLSRDDDSGTHHFERRLWLSLALQPWTHSAGWYQTMPAFPDRALREADRLGMYTLSDRATFLRQRHNLRQTQIYVDGGPELLNTCHVLLRQGASPMAAAFYDYLVGPRGQSIIAGFGASAQSEAYFSPAQTQLWEDQSTATTLESYAPSP